ncbi:MAG: biopolymer transporter ExbD, partial [Treponema sp.]|nr:biopolymer transporter ExbD [Treponema sp.]
ASFEKPAIALSLPKASSGAAEGKTMLTVSVDAQGGVFFEGQEIDLPGLSARLAEYAVPAKDLTVALECDGAAVFDRVVLVMDSIKNAGVRNVAIRHEPQ